MRNRFEDLFPGIVLIAISAFLLLKNSYIYSFNSFRIFGVNSSTLILLLLLASVSAAVVKPSKTVAYVMLGIVCCLLISIVLGMRFYVRRANALTMLAILATGAAGFGYIIRKLLNK